MVEPFFMGASRTEAVAELLARAARLAAAVEVAGTTATGTEVRPRPEQIIPVLQEARRLVSAIAELLSQDALADTGLVRSMDRIATRLRGWIDPGSGRPEGALLAGLLADLRALPRGGEA
jgi:hypothetical protein